MGFWSHLRHLGTQQVLGYLHFKSFGLFLVLGLGFVSTFLLEHSYMLKSYRVVVDGGGQ